MSALELTPQHDGVPSACVVNFGNLHTVPQDAFRRRVTSLSAARMAQACRRAGCWAPAARTPGGVDRAD